MSGRMSREKGRRGEQQLVLYLFKLGYEAERILRQYQEAGQADVKAQKDKAITTFELKCRKASYKRIYDLYYSERGPDGVLAFVLDKPIAVSSNFEDLLVPDRAFRSLEVFPPTPQQRKVYARIREMEKIKQSADYLVLKDNSKARLFIRYWG